MPSIQEAMNNDLSGYEPVAQAGGPAGSPIQPPPSDTQPGLNPMLRCALPPIFQAAPDSLRQFFQGGTIPQTRLLSTLSTGVQGGGGTGGALVQSIGTTNTTTNVIAGSTLQTAQQGTLTSIVLSPGQTFTGMIPLAKGFQLLGLATSSAARVEFYGTAAAMYGDLPRAIDSAPPAGTAQNLICDVVLDTAPYQWSFQGRVGANADSPQTPLIYTTITNIGAAAVAITVTAQFVALEG